MILCATIGKIYAVNWFGDGVSKIKQNEKLSFFWDRQNATYTALACATASALFTSLNEISQCLHVQFAPAASGKGSSRARTDIVRASDRTSNTTWRGATDETLSISVA
jgi:hypothetical protein